MINIIRKAVAVITAALVIAGIVACSMKPAAVEIPAQETESDAAETVTEEPEAELTPSEDYDISSGMKVKDKDGVKTLNTDHFTLTLTHGDSWDVKVNSTNSITIYNKALNKAKRGGKLVTILAFNAGDNSYDVLPDYNIIGESGGMVYIAAYPTDVQFDESDKKSAADYLVVFEEVSRLADGNADKPMVFRYQEGI